MASNATDKSRTTTTVDNTKKENPALDPSLDPTSHSKDLESEIETGGLSAFRPLDHVINRVVEKIESEIKSEINKLNITKKNTAPTLGKSDKLEINGYRLNIVNGYMYFAKIKIHGDSFIQARILETPKGEVSLQSITETKTDADEKEYFKLPCSAQN